MWHHDWRLQSLAFCSVSGPRARSSHHPILLCNPRLGSSENCPTNERARAHAFALLPVYSNSQFRQRLLESRLKVTLALYGSSLHLWPFDCDFLCLSCGFRRRGKGRRQELWGETPARQRVRRRGTPTRPPRIPPRAAPSAEEQLWPLLVTVWISRAVGIDFFPLALPAA